MNRIKNKQKLIIISVIIIVMMAFIVSVRRDSLAAFEENFKDKDVQFFEEKIDELSHADVDDILNFDLKMSVATNTLFVDYDLVKQLDKSVINVNVLRENSISFWRKEIRSKEFFNSQLKDKQDYFVYVKDREVK